MKNCMCNTGLMLPASSAPQQLLHCIFVTSAAGFEYVPGMCILLAFLFVSVC